MQIIDIALLLLGAYFVIRGLIKGFSSELISLVAIIGGFYCAMRFYGNLSTVISEMTGLSDMASSAIAMGGIFLAVNLIAMALRMALKKVIEDNVLGWLDKLLGMLAGFVKIYLVTLAVLMFGMIASPLAGERWISESRVLVTAAKTWPYAMPVLDAIGFLPDLEKLQSDARDFMLRTAQRPIFAGESDEGASDPKLASPQGEAADDAAREPSLIDRFLGLFSSSK